MQCTRNRHVVRAQLERDEREREGGRERERERERLRDRRTEKGGKKERQRDVACRKSYVVCLFENLCLAEPQLPSPRNCRKI